MATQEQRQAQAERDWPMTPHRRTVRNLTGWLLATAGLLVAMAVAFSQPAPTDVNTALQARQPMTAHASHYGDRDSAERFVQRTRYDGACRNSLGKYRCEYVGLPTVDGAAYGHWWHFRQGYYQEWRTNIGNPLVPYKLWACSQRGWVMLPSRYPPHGHGSVIAKRAWRHCWVI